MIGIAGFEIGLGDAVKGGEHDLRFEIEAAKEPFHGCGQRGDIGRLIMIGRRGADGRLPAHGEQRAEGGIVGRGSGRGRVLRVKWEQ